MTVLFGTLGFTPGKFLGAIKTLPGITRVVFYTAHTGRAEDRARSERAVAEVKRTLTSLNIPFRHVPLEDPFDFGAFLTRFLEDIKKTGSEEMVFNLTGGTKPMAVAATVACMVLGVTAYYVPEEQEGAQAIELPIFRIRYSNVLTTKERRVLEEVRQNQPESLTDLADELGIEPSTLSGHLRNLEKLAAVRLISIEGKGQLRRPELTQAGDLLLAVEHGAGVP
ncbi:MAG TPA: DUF6293 family protein [Thermoplasmata archaeon]|nr:DUF6293 family protein [Thermoplasmata archaeon]